MRRASAAREPARRSAAELDPPSRAAALPDHRPQSAALAQLVRAAAAQPVVQLGKQSKRTGGGTKAQQEAADKERRKKQEEIRQQGQRQSQAAKDADRDPDTLADKADKSQKEVERKAKEAREDKVANDRAIRTAYQAVVNLRANPPNGAAPHTINCGDHGVPGGTNSPIPLTRRNGAQAMNVASSLQTSFSGVLSRHYAHADGTIIVHVT